MIQWLETVAPPTQASFSGTSFVSGRVGPGNQITESYSASASETSFANWSVTSSIGETGTSVNSFFSSVSTDVAFTSTKQTVSTAAQVTTTQEWQVTRLTTTAITTNEQTFATSTVFTTTEERLSLTTQASVKTVDSTTTFGSRYAVSLYATVYQAAQDEVLWTAEASGFSDIELQAASDIGGTETRFTVYPWTETSEYQVVATDETTSAFTLSAASQGLSLNGTTTSVQTTTAIELFAEAQIPMKTSNVVEATIATQTTSFGEVVFGSVSNVAVFDSSVSTQFGISLSLFKSTALGVEFDEAKTISTSRTVLVPNDNFVTSSSFNTTLPAETITTTTITGVFPNTGEESGELVGFPYLSSASEINGSTGYAPQTRYFATTAIAQPIIRKIEALSGVSADGDLAGYYDANGLAQTYVADLYVFAAPLVSTAMPLRDVVLYITEGDSENPDYFEVGTVVFNGLTATATTTNSGTDETSSSFTFSLQGQGQPTRVVRAQNNLHFHANLGLSETLYQSIGSGVFADTDGATFSTTFGVTSFMGTSSGCSFYRPVTFVQPYYATQSALVWAVPRNSSDLPA